MLMSRILNCSLAADRPEVDGLCDNILAFRMLNLEDTASSETLDQDPGPGPWTLLVHWTRTRTPENLNMSINLVLETKALLQCG